MQPLRVFLAACLGVLAATDNGGPTSGGKPVAHDGLRAELLRMGERDQRHRTELQDHFVSGSSAPPERILALQRKQDAIDRRNFARLEDIVRQHGWPGRSLVGQEASGAAFLILQHADLAGQKRIFPVFAKAAAEGEARPADAAMLEDRILMREGKKQRYGTQVHSGPETGGKLELYPIEDEDHVDERRAAVGLPPLADYLEIFGLEYEPKGRE